MFRMNLVKIASLLFLGWLSACATLNSTTYIDPQKSFVLGEGAHGGYTAEIKNSGSDPIEVFFANGTVRKSAGILKSGQHGKYRVSSNSVVQIVNMSVADQSIVKIRVKGDTDLSMQFKENR